MGCGNRSRSVGLAHKTGAEASLLSGRGAGHTTAKYGRAKHGPFQARAPVDMSTGHTCHLTCGVKSRNGLKVGVHRAASEVRFDTAEILSGYGKLLNGVKRGRIVFFRFLLKLAKLRFSVQSALAGWF